MLINALRHGEPEAVVHHLGVDTAACLGGLLGDVGEMGDENAGAGPFEIGLLARPQARKLQLGLRCRGDDGAFLCVTGTLQQGVAELPSPFHVDAHLTCTDGGDDSFSTVADVEIEPFVVAQIGLALSTEVHQRSLRGGKRTVESRRGKHLYLLPFGTNGVSVVLQGIGRHEIANGLFPPPRQRLHAPDQVNLLLRETIQQALDNSVIDRLEILEVVDNHLRTFSLTKKES